MMTSMKRLWARATHDTLGELRSRPLRRLSKRTPGKSAGHGTGRPARQGGGHRWLRLAICTTRVYKERGLRQ
jgi:hypothetical protein